MTQSRGKLYRYYCGGEGVGGVGCHGRDGGGQDGDAVAIYSVSPLFDQKASDICSRWSGAGVFALGGASSL